MVSAYNNKQVTWQPFQGMDQYNDPTEPHFYLPQLYSVSKWVHYKAILRQVRDRNGEITLSSGYLIMDVKPQWEDYFVIDGKTHSIIGITTMESFGTVEGYWIDLR